MQSSTASSSSPSKWKGWFVTVFTLILIIKCDQTLIIFILIIKCDQTLIVLILNLCLRGTFIVPSFDEIWPQPGKERAGKARTRMGYDYILEAMQVAVDMWW